MKNVFAGLCAGLCLILLPAQTLAINYMGTEDEEPVYLVEQYSDAEVELLTRIVYAESRGESDLGQKAVANVVLNRVESKKFPNTIHGVVYQRSQFQPTSSSWFATMRADERTKRNVQAVLDGERVLPDNALYFKATYCKVNWRMKHLTTIGNHEFYLG